MDVRELRLGNLVSEYVLGVCPVGGIESDVKNDGIVWLSKDNMRYHITDCNIEPIPLKSKWFKKFGFAKAYLKTWNKEKRPWHYQIEKHPGFPEGYIFFINVDGVAAPPSIKIKYVHELQNLYYALTGEELVIR
jgi:hypothetical protein